MSGKSASRRCCPSPVCPSVRPSDGTGSTCLASVIIQYRQVTMRGGSGPNLGSRSWQGKSAAAFE